MTRNTSVLKKKFFWKWLFEIINFVQSKNKKMDDTGVEPVTFRSLEPKMRSECDNHYTRRPIFCKLFFAVFFQEVF